MGIELPDWLRGVALLGQFGGEYLPVATDESGQLYIVLTGAPEITIPGTVDTNDLNTVKQIQGTDGTTFRTAKLDANGQFIIVPRGQSGNYMAVDASGFLTAILKGTASGGGLVSIAVDASGQLIMVPRGQSGNYMDVDASGFLTAILKGSYAGALKTIATDTDGRMIGIIPDLSGNFGNIDYVGLAELASRLGGLQRWDTRGRILRAVSFDEGLVGQCSIFPSGPPGLELTPTKFESGGYSAKCALSGGAGEYVELYIEVSSGTSLRIGGEISFAFAAANFMMTIKLFRRINSVETTGALLWNLATGVIYYWSSGATYVAIPGATVPTPVASNFNHFKLVVDFSTGKYVRGIAGEYQYDLSALNMRAAAAAAANEIVMDVLVEYNSLVAVTAYVDNMIMTHAEPAN